ncbi:MAG: hypothetical protein Q7K43_02625 [Candidatus Woesearchaeota archaeon]|nr:hypothetical protein [Candidatus Woesearchaeota archaeon]
MILKPLVALLSGRRKGAPGDVIMAKTMDELNVVEELLADGSITADEAAFITQYVRRW